MKNPYSHAFAPPAPILSVQVSNLASSTRSPLIPALVDTGADTTLIPQTLVTPLRLVQAGEVTVQGFEGPPRTATIYDVVLSIVGATLVGLPVVTFSADYVLLGRDVLNHLRLLLNGPALTLEILPSA